MKNLFFCLIATSLTFLLCSSSCEKKNSSKSGSRYAGTWKYIGYSGGIAGFRFKENFTQTHFLQLDDSTYIEFNAGQKRCGSYTVIAKLDHGIIPGPYLAFDHAATGSALRLQGDTLILTQPVADGMSFWYVKKDTVLSGCGEETTVNTMR